MSRFEHCRPCGRLNLLGARCICTPIPTMTCDCTYSGNVQHIGPLCRQRIHDVWSEVFRSGPFVLSPP